MPPEPSKPPAETGLIIQRGAGLMTLPSGGSPALSEMISRSLVHLQTSKALAVPERRPGEECDFEIAPGVMMRMCWIPPGEFFLGSPEDEQRRGTYETQHRVAALSYRAALTRNLDFLATTSAPTRSTTWAARSRPAAFSTIRSDET